MHDDDVEPAVELPADGGERSNVSKAEGRVQADGALVGGVADTRQHLSDAQHLATGDERGEKGLADACGEASQASIGSRNLNNKKPKANMTCFNTQR